MTVLCFSLWPGMTMTPLSLIDLSSSTITFRVAPAANMTHSQSDTQSALLLSLLPPCP